MSTTAKPKSTTENRQYKKKEDLAEVQKWCILYPWYARLVDDIHEILAHRAARHSATYSVVVKPKANRGSNV